MIRRHEQLVCNSIIPGVARSSSPATASRSLSKSAMSVLRKVGADTHRKVVEVSAGRGAIGYLSQQRLGPI